MQHKLVMKNPNMTYSIMNLILKIQRRVLDGKSKLIYESEARMAHLVVHWHVDLVVCLHFTI